MGVFFVFALFILLYRSIPYLLAVTEFHLIAVARVINRNTYVLLQATLLEAVYYYLV
jgi:hypothetical protein